MSREKKLKLYKLYRIMQNKSMGMNREDFMDYLEENFQIVYKYNLPD